MAKTPEGESGVLLALLKNSEKEMSVSALAKLVGLSRMGALLIVRKLEKEGMLTVRKVGRSSLCAVDLSSSHTRKYLTFLLSKEAEKASPYVRRWISELRRLKNAKAALLFGSVLRKERGAQDIDVLLITDQRHIAKLEAEIDALNRMNPKPIHPVYQSSADFRRNLRKKDPVVLNAVKGIVAFGEEELYEPGSEQA